jgi:hypothetical protein
MPDTLKQPRFIASLLLLMFSTQALAADDWLITRVNGRWTWESTGLEGRVHKQFLNQEVLRLEENGTVVAVSLQPIPEGKIVLCSETARHNPKDACSSAFLECQAAGGGPFSALLGLVMNGSKGVFDARNAYRCSINEDAVLEAAHAVGLIENILPRESKKLPDPAANASSNYPF